jgi:hypothetical protein
VAAPLHPASPTPVGDDFKVRGQQDHVRGGFGVGLPLCWYLGRVFRATFIARFRSMQADGLNQFSVFVLGLIPAPVEPGLTKLPSDLGIDLPRTVQLAKNM